MQLKILDQDNMESILDTLSSLDNHQISRDQETGVYLKLKALIYLRPDDARALGRYLSKADPSKRSSELIVTALSTVGSPEAQDALCAAIREKGDDPLALAAFGPLLGRIQHPSEHVLAVLETLSTSANPDTRSIALLALGAAAKNVAHYAEARSSRIVEALEFRLPVSVGNDKTDLLLALGNTGSDSAMETLLGSKADDSPLVRRTISLALGGFESVESDRAQCEMLRKDPDPRVRATAAQAVAPRNRMKPVKDALMEAAKEDDTEAVRIASLFALTTLIDTDQTVRQLIADVAHKDVSEVVRQQAARLLQNKGAGQLEGRPPRPRDRGNR